jgi:hypothetical protein
VRRPYRRITAGPVGPWGHIDLLVDDAGVELTQDQDGVEQGITLDREGAEHLYRALGDYLDGRPS